MSNIEQNHIYNILACYRLSSPLAHRISHIALQMKLQIKISRFSLVLKANFYTATFIEIDCSLQTARKLPGFVFFAVNASLQITTQTNQTSFSYCRDVSTFNIDYLWKINCLSSRICARNDLTMVSESCKILIHPNSLFSSIFKDKTNFSDDVSISMEDIENFIEDYDNVDTAAVSAEVAEAIQARQAEELAAGLVNTNINGTVNAQSTLVDHRELMGNSRASSRNEAFDSISSILSVVDQSIKRYKNNSGPMDHGGIKVNESNAPNLHISKSMNLFSLQPSTSRHNQLHEESYDEPKSSQKRPRAEKKLSLRYSEVAQAPPPRLAPYNPGSQRQLSPSKIPISQSSSAEFSLANRPVLQATEFVSENRISPTFSTNMRRSSPLNTIRRSVEISEIPLPPVPRITINRAPPHVALAPQQPPVPPPSPQVIPPPSPDRADQIRQQPNEVVQPVVVTRRTEAANGAPADAEEDEEDHDDPYYVHEGEYEPRNTNERIRRAMNYLAVCLNYERRLQQEPPLPASRMGRARRLMTITQSHPCLTVMKVLENRALIIHPVLYPDVSFSIVDMLEVERTVRAFLSTFYSEEQNLDPMNRVVTFIRHYGAIIIVCTSLDMMTNIMQLNLESAADRVYSSPGPDNTQCTLMLRKFDNSFFDCCISFSTKNQLCLNEEAMRNIAKAQVTELNTDDWFPIGARRGFEVEQNRVITEFYVNRDDTLALRRALEAVNAPRLRDNMYDYFVRFANERFGDNNVNVTIVGTTAVIQKFAEELNATYNPSRGVLTEADQVRMKQQSNNGRKRPFLN